jgi:hypothetical protein
MKTILTIALTLLLIGLLPMWPYTMPSAVALVLGGLAMFAVVLAYHVFTDRPHHWPR